MIIVIAIMQPHMASCPPRYWVNGIRPDGRYECLLTVGDNDDPAIDTIAGKLSCPPDTTPIVVSFQHVACKRIRS